MKTKTTARQNRAQEPLAQALGQRLRSLRKERGWTQTELAQKMGLHFTIVGYYERGTHYPPLPTLTKLATLLGVSLDELVGDGRGVPDRFQDAELLQFFLRADKLDHKTRSTVKDILESVLVKAELDRQGQRNRPTS